MASQNADTPRRYGEFWPFYLREHSRMATRAFHYVGTSLAICCLILAAVISSWRLIVLAVVCGYLFAWIGHIASEHNRPATFRHPFWSLFSDLRMYALALSGRLGPELERAGVPRNRR